MTSAEGSTPPKPLEGIKVLDVSALGPGPFAGMLLADFGADVIAVERPDADPDSEPALFARGKRSVFADLKSDRDRDRIESLAAEADVFLEGYRPGVMERLGLGPDELLARNPALVYVRLTGWGQDGPYALRAGHDVNYIAIAGALGVIGPTEPVIPLSVVGDFAAGSLVAVMGILAALRVRDRTGQGQVIDAAIVDGTALLLTCQWELHARGQWGERGSNLVDGLAPFYGVYQCSDGNWFSVGAMEPKFYQAFLRVVGIDDADSSRQLDTREWPALRARLATIFGTRTRADWETAFAAVDTCAAPVLTLDEVGVDPHIAHRGVVVPDKAGGWRAAPAPRLSVTPAAAGEVPTRGEHTDQIFRHSGWPEPAPVSRTATGAERG